MIAVFVPALILEIFTIYFIVKVVSKNLHVSIWGLYEFVYWNMMLVAPKVCAIYISVTTISKVQQFTKYIRNYSSFCTRFNQQQMILLSSKFDDQLIFTCGFFDFNWQLGLSILSSITTYMIIVCQFEVDK